MGEEEEIDAFTAKVMLQKQASQEVRRDFKRACKLIENAAMGIFPKTSWKILTPDTIKMQFEWRIWTSC